MPSHHAIVCIAASLDQSDIPEQYKTQSNDISHIITDRFSIADARALSQNVLQKPIESDLRVFVIVAAALPVESQNALLKLFEEPPAHAQFYLVIPQEGMLLPTLRSRVQISTVVDDNQHLSPVFNEFQSASYAQRLETVADFSKKKEVAKIEQLLTGAEKYAVKNPLQNKDLLESVLFIRTYIKTPGASSKMLLEELALALPKA